MTRALVLAAIGEETIAEFLRQSGKASVTVASVPEIPRAKELRSFDLVVVCPQSGKLTARAEKSLLDFVGSGKGIVAIGSAFSHSRGYGRMLGITRSELTPPYTFPLTVAKRDHDITTRVDDFEISDRLCLVSCDSSERKVLLSTFWQGKPVPVLYTKKYRAGRVAYFAAGNTPKALLNHELLRLVCRAVDWAVGGRETGTIRCSVLGYGPAFNMGKAHANLMVNTPGLELAAVCDLDPSRTTAAEEDFPGIRTYNSVKELCADPDVDLVSIVTPHNTHAPLALTCLRAGKHVVVEKPFCITSNEATRMIEQARRSRVMLTVFHNRRLDGDFLAIKEVVERGMIGEVFHIEAYSGGYNAPRAWWRSDKKISGGAMYDWGAHFLDWILNLMPGRIESVVGFFHKRVWHSVTNEDQCQAIMRFEGGRYAEYQTSSIAAVGKHRWRILGTKGGILPGNEAISVTALIGGEMTTLSFKHKPRRPHLYYYNIADHLLRGEPLMVTPESARRVIAVLEAAERSAASGRAEKVPYE